MLQASARAVLWHALGFAHLVKVFSKTKKILIPIFPLFQMSSELCLVLKPGAGQNVNVSGNYVHGKAHSHKSDCFPVLALDCMVSNEYNGEIS